MDLGLSGKVFIVGGGSRGLGRGAARVLVREGASVVVIGRDPERLAAASAQLGQDSALTLAADVGDEDTPDRAVDAALQRFGRLDGAVINTGGPRVASVEELNARDWEDATRAVLLGPVRLADRVIDQLCSDAGTGGALVFILSTSVRAPLPRLALSNAIRPGLALHLKDLADAYGAPPRSVRVNGLLPAGIRTDRNAMADDAAQLAPLRRAGDPEEFGRVAAFLLSDAASFVTGSLVTVDGGLSRAG